MSNSTPNVNPKNISYRAPSRQYEHRNGFTEPPQTLQQKLELHEVALDTLRLRSVPIPSLQELLETDWKQERDTVQSVKELIEKERADQKEFLSKLYDLNATAYIEDVEYRYLSRNEVLDKDPREYVKEEKERRARNNESVDDLLSIGDHELQRMSEVTEQHRKLFDETYPYPFSPTAPSPDTLPTINRHNHAYLKRIIDLQKRLRLAETAQAAYDKEMREKLQQEEYNKKRWEEERRRQEEEKKKAFPATIAEFEAKEQWMKDRVIRFLGIASNQDIELGKQLAPQQKSMLKEYGWTEEDVMPLIKIYANNPAFRVDIQLKYSLSGRKTRDPRLG